VNLEQFGVSTPELLETRVRPLLSSLGTLFVNSLLTLLGNGVLVLLFLFFMLMGLRERGPDFGPTWEEIELSLRSYISAMVVISALTALVHGLALWACGVKFALAFALLAFFLNFLPNLGPIIASFMHLPVMLLTPEWTLAGAVLALSLPGAVQFISGNLITPKYLGDALNIHPIVLMAFLIFFGIIWGTAGMFLAAPLAATAKILLSKIPQTRPLAAVFDGDFESVLPTGAANQPPPKQDASE
jgi:AI-2 transport protein TqsA